MTDQTDHISFSCVECGSNLFSFPNNPAKDDDIVSCGGCGREIGRYDVIREAAIKAGKTEIDQMVLNAFGKKPTWDK